MTLPKGGAYTIVLEKNGWGKLKSGIGWISLNIRKKSNKKKQAPEIPGLVCGYFKLFCNKGDTFFFRIFFCKRTCFFRELSKKTFVGVIKMQLMKR